MEKTIWKRYEGKNIGILFRQLYENGSLLYLKMDDEKIPHFPPVDIYLYVNKKDRETKVDSSLNGISFEDEMVNLKDLIFPNIGFIPSLLSGSILKIINKAFKK